MRDWTRARGDRKAAGGFTVIEMIVVLAVVAVLVALLTPLALQSVQSSREETTRKEVEGIFRAIVGDPQKGTFGYLGDMGRLPATLTELAEQGSQTAFHTGHGGTPHIGSVGAGWRGPYVTGPFAASELFRDGWGQLLGYTSTGPAAGQVLSGGPDGNTASAADNVVFPAQLPVPTTGTLLVTVLVNNIPQPSGLTVEVFSTNASGDQGAPVTRTTAADGNAPFTFAVPHGVSVIRATHTVGAVTVSRTVTVPVAAGTQVTRQVVLTTSAAVAM